MVSKEITEKKGWPTINLNKISVSKANVRTLNKTEKIDELAESIKKYKLLQPVVVYEQTPGKFELIIGQRRFLAFKQLAKKYDVSAYYLYTLHLKGELHAFIEEQEKK